MSKCKEKYTRQIAFLNKYNIKPDQNGFRYVCHHCATVFGYANTIIKSIKNKHGESQCECCVHIDKY